MTRISERFRSSYREASMFRQNICWLLVLGSTFFLTGCRSNGNSWVNSQIEADQRGNFPIRLMVTVGGKTGYIDQSGKLIINPQWDEAFQFQEGRAMVCVG